MLTGDRWLSSYEACYSCRHANTLTPGHMHTYTCPHEVGRCDSSSTDLILSSEFYRTRHFEQNADKIHADKNTHAHTMKYTNLQIGTYKNFFIFFFIFFSFLR